MSPTATRDDRLQLGTAAERQILLRVDRAVKVGERELRYQLDRKDRQPLAHEDELLDVLADLEAAGWTSPASVDTG